MESFFLNVINKETQGPVDILQKILSVEKEEEGCCSEDIGYLNKLLELMETQYETFKIGNLKNTKFPFYDIVDNNFKTIIEGIKKTLKETEKKEKIDKLRYEMSKLQSELDNLVDENKEEIK